MPTDHPPSEAKKPANPTAFPIAYDMGCEMAPEVRVSHGMSLRDYFAAKAMQAIIATSGDVESRRYLAKQADPNAGLAADAYAMADAMLAARAKP
jgi:hypothetical protein